MIMKKDFIVLTNTLTVIYRNGVERSLVDCNFPTECIVAGDMNAHHEWWDSSIQTPIRADTLVELMENSNFELLNALNQSTYNKRTGRGSSILDLTLPPKPPLPGSQTGQ